MTEHKMGRDNHKEASKLMRKSIFKASGNNDVVKSRQKCISRSPLNRQSGEVDRTIKPLA